MKKDPQRSGSSRGDGGVRDISKALKEEGIELGPMQVHGILNDLGLSYKRPKLTVESNDPSFARKAREIRRYKQIAPALEKEGSRSVRGRDLALALPEGRSGVDASRRAEAGPHTRIQQA